MSIRDEQRRRYRELWARFGEDPRALGHRDTPTQYERFQRLSAGFTAEPGSFTVHEIGSGFGDYGLYLSERFPAALYSGSEICEEFVEVARRRIPGARFHLRDVTEELPEERWDYVTQSGTFNGKWDTSPADWQHFVFSMLEAMFALARKGIAVNFLTSYADPPLMRPELHYQEPGALLDFVVEQLSRHFEIDAGGPLFEYTLRVWRPEYVRAAYDGEEFGRYFGER